MFVEILLFLLFRSYASLQWKLGIVAFLNLPEIEMSVFLEVVIFLSLSHAI